MFDRPTSPLPPPPDDKLRSNKPGKAGDRDGGGGRTAERLMEIAGEAGVSARWEDAIVDRSMDHRTLYTLSRMYDPMLDIPNIPSVIGS